MPDKYELTLEEIAARQERIERRLDNMGQRIAYLEGYVMGVRKDTELPRSLSSDSAWEKSQRSHRRFMRIGFAMCWALIAMSWILFFGILLKLI